MLKLFLSKIIYRIKESSLLFYSFLLLFGLLYTIYKIENTTGNQMFKTMWDGVWWGIVTAGTIGYGDKFPQSFWGQFFAILYIFVSLGIFTQIMGKIVDSLNSKISKKMNGTLKTKLKNHIILYGENDLGFSNIIDQILNSDKNEKVVVITKDSQIPKELANLDIDHSKNFDWISGSPDDHKVLELANVKEATSFILFREEGNSNSDKFLLSYVMSIKEYNPKINIIADIVDSKKRNIFHTAGCNSVINTEEISEKLLYRSLTDGIHRLVDNLLKCDDGFEMYKTNINPKWVGKTFTDINTYYFDNDLNMISVGNDNKEFFYKRDYTIKAGDFAFIISKDRLNEI